MQEDINRNFNAPEVGININVDGTDWVHFILAGIKTIETRPESCASQWRQHVGETIGIIRTSSRTKDIPTGLLVGTATLVSVKLYKTKSDFLADRQKHLYTMVRDWENNKRCGLVLDNVKKVRPRRLKPKGIGTIRKIEFA